MKKIFLIITLMFLITSCSGKQKVYNPENIEGISMEIKEGTLTSKEATIVINDTIGNEVYAFNEEFIIEKKDGDKWKALKVKGSDCAVHPRLYFADETGIIEMEQNWECLYKSLAKGNYRLIKSVNLVKENNENNLKYIATEFTIE